MCNFLKKGTPIVPATFISESIKLGHMPEAPYIHGSLEEEERKPEANHADVNLSVQTEAIQPSVESVQRSLQSDIKPAPTSNASDADTASLNSDKTESEEEDLEKKNTAGREVRNQESWACMKRGHSYLKDANPNQHITDEFQKLVDRAQGEGEQWRVISYRKAINILKKLPKKVTRVEDVQGIRGIGTAMRTKIEEILATGFIRKAHTQPENHDVVSLFKNIYGVGEKISRKAKGYKTLEDLAKKAELTKDQQLGLKYYDDFLKRIPRHESITALDIMTQVVHKIDPDIELQLMGSFRRGSPDSGDIDVLITHTDGVSHEASFHKFLAALKKSAFILDDLTWKTQHEKGNLIYKGICRVKGKTHLYGIDLIELRGSSSETNRHSGRAGQKGLSLSQHGLFEVIRDSNREKVAEKLIVSKTERVY
ncbi:hypothetical protein HDU97_000546 [Phlyctochytrium planicorne]|nr:hypothetical protein HDU97_000546 [Phlyctochytrium planicorne]